MCQPEWSCHWFRDFFFFFFTTIDDAGLSRHEFGLMELHYYRLFIYYILDYLYLGLVSTCLNSSYLYPELCECCVVILFLLFKNPSMGIKWFFFTQVYLNVQVWCRLELHVYNIFFLLLSFNSVVANFACLQSHFQPM